MKKILITLPVFIGLLFLASCKKDEVKVQTSGGTTPVLNASAAIFNLVLATKDLPGGTFNWTASDYKYEGQDVNYTLQFDTAGRNFAQAKETTLGTNTTSKTFTQAELNGMALSATKVLAGGSALLDFRVKAYLGAGLKTVYSGKVTVQLNTYDLVVFWYTPGDYQGWDPPSAPKLGSSDLASYEGFVNVPAGGTYKFKITSDPDWNHTNYGGGPGTLSSTGPDLTWPAAGGYYLVTANKTTLSWAASKTTWSIIGDGASGWSTDVAMTYDAVNKVWKATTTLSSGGFIKFRANNDWTTNFGIGPNPAFLDYNGANIPITSGGSHTVILNLNNPRRYTYTIQ